MKQSTKAELINHLEINTGVLTPKIKRAFEEIDRKDFVDDDYKMEAYNDYPLPIGHGQTISQPTMVAIMFRLIDPQKGERILDVGCGSGWTTVLLGYLVGEEGEVVGVDVIDEFVELTRNRLSAYENKAPNVAVFHSSEEDLIYTDNFDKILVSASFESENDIPERMKDSLNEGGLMVCPVGNDLLIYCKENGKFKEKERKQYSVSFVPYITKF